jgi:hypothetical protein
VYHKSRSDLEQQGKWTRRRIETQCREHSAETTTCVPVFRRENREERIDLYFVTHDEEGRPTDVSEVGDFRLL